MKINAANKKAFAIILAIIFIGINLLHVYWPIHLVLEDIDKGTLEGTNIEMAVLYPWIIEFFAIPFVLAEVVYFIVFRRIKYTNAFNLISFSTFILQVLLFNVLLWF